MKGSVSEWDEAQHIYGGHGVVLAVKGNHRLVDITSVLEKWGKLRWDLINKD